MSVSRRIFGKKKIRDKLEALKLEREEARKEGQRQLSVKNGTPEERKKKNLYYYEKNKKELLEFEERMRAGGVPNRQPFIKPWKDTTNGPRRDGNGDTLKGTHAKPAT